MTTAPLSSEFVPLAEAAAAAYQVLSRGSVRSGLSDDELLEVRARVALALGAVATIFVADGGSRRPVTLHELESKLFAPPDGMRRKASGAIDGLEIRRADLLHAIELLKGAGSDFS